MLKPLLIEFSVISIFSFFFLMNHIRTVGQLFYQYESQESG